ncbi:MAG: sigma-54-dependent Fis family transcriptional regulator, partial [Gemmatimonadetes bacterium]|nr:sigma-54-dependent Fis family transcriptional regulator [Gemmatimonadota bacterium]
MRSGAADYLPMPVRADALALALEHARTDAALRDDRRAIAREQGAAAEGRLVGASRQMQELRRLIAMVAPTNASVLIEGESGTGKELVARSVHAQSQRADAPFVTINCAAMPEGLIESTLFGHEKGAFTGATQRQVGAFERADGGTLFLDEISE